MKNYAWLLQAAKSVCDCFVFFDTIIPPDKGTGARKALYDLQAAVWRCMESGVDVVHAFPVGETIVAMTVFRDRLYVATSRGMYVKLDDDKLYRLEMVEKKDER